MASWKSIFRESVRGRVMLSQAMVYSRFRYWLYSLMPSEKVDNYIASDVKTLIWSSKPEFKSTEKGSSTGAPPWMTKGAAIRPFGDGGGAGVLDWQTHQDGRRT